MAYNGKEGEISYWLVSYGDFFMRLFANSELISKFAFNTKQHFAQFVHATNCGSLAYGVSKENNTRQNVVLCNQLFKEIKIEN